jgi:phage shock protein A
VALQQHTAQLTEKYDHLSAEYAQLKASQAQQRAESEQQKATYEQLREMVMKMATQSGTYAPNPFW